MSQSCHTGYHWISCVHIIWDLKYTIHCTSKARNTTEEILEYVLINSSQYIAVVFPTIGNAPGNWRLVIGIGFYSFVLFCGSGSETVGSETFNMIRIRGYYSGSASGQLRIRNELEEKTTQKNWTNLQIAQFKNINSVLSKKFTY
jgi:hypothetical protein